MKKQLVRLISLALLAALLQACSPYLAREVPKEPLPKLDEKIVNLFWPGQEYMEIHLRDVSLEGETLKGRADRYLESNPYNYGNQWIDVYISDQVAKPDSLPCDMSFDISQIQKIKVYDPSTAKVVGNITLLTMAEFAIMGMTYAIILALKESCPFVYVWDGESYVLTGETYSGDIFPFLERHDYLALPELKPESGAYKLKLTNEVKEAQHTNLTELIVVDHPAGTSVLLDKLGNCQIWSDPKAPISALAVDGTDLTDLLAKRDQLRYMGGSVSDSDPGTDAVTLSFQRPRDARTARLLLRGKSSFWLDYTLVKWFDLFGSYYNPWYKKQTRRPKGLNPNWAVEQGIQLSVYVRKHDSWEFVDFFNVTGPMADRDLVMPLDLSGIDGEEVKVMLKSGFMFWEYDYTALDFSDPADVSVRVLPLISALDQNGSDVTALMTKDDKKYQTMDRIGNQVLLSFAAPDGKDGLQRSVFLHGKGHYKILRAPSGKPDISYLKQFRQPGRLSLFSLEKFIELGLSRASKEPAPSR